VYPGVGGTCAATATFIAGSACV